MISWKSHSVPGQGQALGDTAPGLPHPARAGHSLQAERVLPHCPCSGGQEALRELCGIWNVPAMTVKSRHSLLLFSWHWSVRTQGLRKTSKQQKLPSAFSFATFEHREAFSFQSPAPKGSWSQPVPRQERQSMQSSPGLVQGSSDIWEQERSLCGTEESCPTPSITLALHVAMYFCIILDKEFLANTPICHGRENNPIQICLQSSNKFGVL